MLLVAALLTFTIGLAHSFLGEKTILVRLFRKNSLPKLYGSDWLTKRTLRFAWHITTIAWFGLAALMLVSYFDVNNLETAMLLIIAVVFGVSGLVSAIFSKFKHFSWVIFWLISGLCWYVATSS